MTTDERDFATRLDEATARGYEPIAALRPASPSVTSGERERTKPGNLCPQCDQTPERGCAPDCPLQLAPEPTEGERLAKLRAEYALWRPTCPVCKGKGQLSDAVLAWDEGGPVPDCPYCDEGRIDLERLLSDRTPTTRDREPRPDGQRTAREIERDERALVLALIPEGVDAISRITTRALELRSHPLAQPLGEPRPDGEA